MFSSKDGLRKLVIASIAFSGFMFLALWTPPSTKLVSSSYQEKMEKGEDELERVLSRASMENKTLIIAILNKAYVEGEKSMLELFIESLWVGEGTQLLINHVLLVAMDETAYDRCVFLRLNCYRLMVTTRDDGEVDFGGEKLYMSRDFINMMWRRTSFLADVLMRGYSFIFTDIDVMWLRNPLPRLHLNQIEDMQISCDMSGSRQWCKHNLINTGFYFVRSNNKTIYLFNKWYAMRNNTNYTGMKEQDVLKSMIQGGELKELGLKIRYLDTVYFSGFCENSRRFGLVITVHANCCRTINAKVVDLAAVLDDWKKLKALVSDWKRLRRSRGNQTRILQWSDHTACINSWSEFNGGRR